MVARPPAVDKAAEQLEQFVARFAGSSAAIYFDSDADGICAGVILDKYLQTKKVQVIAHLYFEQEAPPFSEAFAEKLRQKKISLLVMTDFSIAGFGLFEKYKQFIEENKDIAILITDHHPPEKVFSIDSTRILYINPTELKLNIPGAQYCCSKFNYDLTSANNPSMETHAWIAAIGIIGDYNQKTWGDFVREVLKRENKKKAHDEEPWQIPKDDDEDFYLTPFGRAANYVMYGCAKSEKEPLTIFELIKRSNNVSAILQAMKIYEPIKREIYDYVENYDYFLKHSPKMEGTKVVEIEVKSNHQIKSIISNILSGKNHDTLFIVYQEEKDGFVYCSLRFQKNTLDLGAVAKACALKCQGNGGGHPQAAGARIPGEHFKYFKEQLYEEIEKE